MTVRSLALALLAAVVMLVPGERADARQYFLTIGGGYNPSGNQVSLEKNVLFFQRLLDEQGLAVIREPETLALNEIGRIRLRTAERLPVDDYARQRRTGAFLVIDVNDGTTLAATRPCRMPARRSRFSASQAIDAIVPGMNSTRYDKRRSGRLESQRPSCAATATPDRLSLTSDGWHT